MPATKTQTSTSFVRKAVNSTTRVAVDSLYRLRSMGAKHTPSNSAPAIASSSAETPTRLLRRRVKAQALPTSKQPLDTNVANSPDCYDMTKIKQALPRLDSKPLEPTAILDDAHAGDDPSSKGHGKPEVSLEATLVTDSTSPHEVDRRATPELTATHSPSPSPSPPSTPHSIAEDQIDAMASTLKELALSPKVATVEPAEASRRSFLETVLNVVDTVPAGNSSGNSCCYSVCPPSTPISDFACSLPRPVGHVPCRPPRSSVTTIGRVHEPGRADSDSPLASHSYRAPLLRVKEKRAAGRADPYTKARAERASRKTHLPPGAYLEIPADLRLRRIRSKSEGPVFETLPPLHIVLAELEAERELSHSSPALAPCIPLPLGWELLERYDEDIDMDAY